ncbi:hypothetical protein BK785_09385 [Bacillus thuringiensis serovar bolivia]|nr:hypothetical protein BK785_09385 [Bacillus thuringiensis serovar bolivia]OUA80083.1 hypothetical protein BK787_03690 [Bacillus thuringiensis serovar pahangi]
MAKYRKKPIVIEAEQFTAINKDRVYRWIGNCEAIFVDGKPALKIRTLEGDMIANIGDYVIKGVNGEFYPCKADIFEKTYESVDEGTRRVY